MKLAKSFALKALAAGFELPEEPITRYLELSLLKRLLDDLSINCVLDVGANRGQFARELRGIGYAGDIVSFEPQLAEFRTLKQAFANDPRWRGYQLALGSRNDHLQLNVFSGLTVLSSLLQPISKQENLAVESVEVKRLDELFPELVGGLAAPRVFLKMDTQGYDLEVFRGARGCAANLMGLQSELSVQPIYEGMPHYLEALAAYEEAGFDLFNLSLVARTPERGLQELNCFMRRTSTGGTGSAPMKA